MDNKTLQKLINWTREGKTYRCYQLNEWRGKNGIRSQALARDRYECQDCAKLGKYSKAVEVHHIKELKTHPHLFLNLDNVICLCKECHNKRHDRDQRGGNKKIKKFETVERW